MRAVGEETIVMMNMKKTFMNEVLSLWALHSLHQSFRRAQSHLHKISLIIRNLLRWLPLDHMLELC